MTLYKVWFGKSSPDFFIILNGNDTEIDLWGLIGSQYPEYYDQCNENDIYDIQRC